MKVLKFGGTSVANAENINKVIQIVSDALKEESILVVVSALGGTTDALLDCGSNASLGSSDYKLRLAGLKDRHLELTEQLLSASRKDTNAIIETAFREIEELCNGISLLKELSARTKDRLVSYGELLSSRVIAAAFADNGIANIWKDSRELILTDSSYGNASVHFEATKEKVVQFVSGVKEKLVVLPGFIASDANGVTTTLGRGGSDYTAALLAAAAEVSALEIWTDVSGMMTADPRFVANARIIPSICYEEAMELSHFGAKVIYPPTIQPVMAKDIPVWIKNTFRPGDAGTVIHNKEAENNTIVKGISSINNITLLTLQGSGMVGVPGFSRRLFEALYNMSVNVILITQGSSEHSICVGINSDVATLAKNSVDRIFASEILAGKVEPVSIESDLSIVALVGEQMKRHTGVSGKMFEALGRNGVNIRAIAQGSSERNISAVIDTANVRKAVNVLHEEFFETTYKQVNIFLAGVGNVGSKLLHQLHQQQDFLQKHLRLQVRLAGIANSKEFVVREEGMSADNTLLSFESGQKGGIDDYVNRIIKCNLRNSIFVDVTANAAVANSYERLLEKSIAVVACNKIAASSSYAHYKKLKDVAREYNASFLFETNVGAGLPVIGTLNDLIRSGDEIQRIEAVLSGTLNFVFNNYNGERPFAEVVRQAQDEGYTEPDPRLDLGGTDVMRKILILAREAGRQLEMEDISNNSFMPASCMEGSVENFYKEMARHEAHFRKLYDEAAAANCKLKFVASYKDRKAAVGLQYISPQQDLYHLYGKDNVVLFYSNRYPEQPLVVKGAGAGAEVTASGVFADIVRAARV